MLSCMNHQACMRMHRTDMYSRHFLVFCLVHRTRKAAPSRAVEQTLLTNAHAAIAFAQDQVGPSYPPLSLRMPSRPNNLLSSHYGSCVESADTCFNVGFELLVLNRPFSDKPQLRSVTMKHAKRDLASRPTSCRVLAKAFWFRSCGAYISLVLEVLSSAAWPQRPI